MATNNDLDDFFKKKDRKVNKHKKQTGLLTNNEELLKQLVIVTSATSAFKENMDFDEEDDEEMPMNNHSRHHHLENTNGVIDNNEMNFSVMNKNQSHSASTNSKSKNTAKLSVQDINEQQTGVGQQDEWEELDDSNSKYQQLRLKISRATNEQNNGNEDEDNDDYSDDGHNHDGNTDGNLAGEDGDQPSRGNRRREQQKDKPVWKLDQVKATEPLPTTNDATDASSEKKDESAGQAKPATTGPSVYRPPALRNNSSVTVVGNTSQRPSKKEKPNLASTEEFPTLGAAVNKK